MKGMTGWEVASYVKEKAPSTAVALITGWGTQLDEKTLRTKGIDFVVSKPYRISEVKKLINQAMAMKEKE